MLIKYFGSLVFLFITVSCASFSDHDEKIPANLPPSSQHPMEKLSNELEIFHQATTDFASKHLKWAAQCGDIHKVKHLLESRPDIPADAVGNALEKSAIGGHTPIVELLLKSRPDIPAYYVGYALEKSAIGGHTPIVKLLLQSRPDIPSRQVWLAILLAAYMKKSLMVECLLDSHPYMYADYFRISLLGAVKGGHVHIVERILQRRNDIFAYDVLNLFSNETYGKEYPKFKRFLQCHTDISTNDNRAALSETKNYISGDVVVYALAEAARLGHIPIVELFTNSDIEIPVSCVGYALSEAARCGSASIVELLLLRRPDITDDDFGRALSEAAFAGKISIVELLLLSRPDIPADYVVRALSKSS